MYRPRIIPVLLLKNKHLIKTRKFKEDRYIGDPINAIRIFNESYADELIILDIYATREKRCISTELVRLLNEETNMPFGVGGGIKNCNQIMELIQAGAEKVIIGSEAYFKPKFINEAANRFGSSTIMVCIDVKTDFWGKAKVYVNNGKHATGKTPVEFAKHMEQMGAGEIIIQSIERDGEMNGYDIALLEKITSSVQIPVVALGGAGTIEHFRELYSRVQVNGLAAGSFFVYNDKNRGVLINYPGKKVIEYLTAK